MTTPQDSPWLSTADLNTVESLTDEYHAIAEVVPINNINVPTEPRTTCEIATESDEDSNKPILPRPTPQSASMSSSRPSTRKTWESTRHKGGAIILSKEAVHFKQFVRSLFDHEQQTSLARTGQAELRCLECQERVQVVALNRCRAHAQRWAKKWITALGISQRALFRYHRKIEQSVYYQSFNAKRLKGLATKLALTIPSPQQTQPTCAELPADVPAPESVLEQNPEPCPAPTLKWNLNFPTMDKQYDETILRIFVTNREQIDSRNKPWMYQAASDDNQRSVDATNADPTQYYAMKAVADGNRYHMKLQLSSRSMLRTQHQVEDLSHAPRHITTAMTELQTNTPGHLNEAIKLFLAGRPQQRNRVAHRPVSKPKVLSRAEIYSLFHSGSGRLMDYLRGDGKLPIQLPPHEVLKMYPKHKMQTDIASLDELFPIRSTFSCPLEEVVITRNKVLRLLTSRNKAAAGPDGLTYEDIRSMDHDCEFVTELINTCFREGKLPDCFNFSYVVFIQKDLKTPKHIQDARPLGLQSCLYKLVTAALSEAIQYWMESTGQRTWNQFAYEKQFSGAFDGLYAATTIHRLLIDDALINKKELILLHLDLKAAFYSVPHDAIYAAMQAIGLSGSILELIKNIYKNHVMVDPDTGINVQVTTGVIVGDCISPTLFNIVLEFLLSQVTHQGYAGINRMMYADDIVLIGTSVNEINGAIYSLVEQFAKINMKLNPKKCQVLHLNQNPNELDQVVIGECPVKAICTDGSDSYLGFPIIIQNGKQLGSTAILTRIPTETRYLMHKDLGHHMKLSLLHHHVISLIPFPFRQLPIVPHTDLLQYHRKWRMAVRIVFGLSDHFPIDGLEATLDMGGLGIIPFEWLAASYAIKYPITLLNSENLTIRDTWRMVYEQKQPNGIIEKLTYYITKSINIFNYTLELILDVNTNRYCLKVQEENRMIGQEKITAWFRNKYREKMFHERPWFGYQDGRNRWSKILGAAVAYNIAKKPTPSPKQAQDRARNIFTARWMTACPIAHSCRKCGSHGEQGIMHVFFSCRALDQRRAMINHLHEALVKDLIQFATRSQYGNQYYILADAPILDTKLRPDLFIIDPKRKKIAIVEVGIFTNLVHVPIDANPVSTLGLDDPHDTNRPITERDAVIAARETAMLKGEWKLIKYKGLQDRLRDIGWDTSLDYFMANTLCYYDPANDKALKAIGIIGRDKDDFIKSCLEKTVHYVHERLSFFFSKAKYEEELHPNIRLRIEEAEYKHLLISHNRNIRPAYEQILEPFIPRQDRSGLRSLFQLPAAPASIALPKGNLQQNERRKPTKRKIPKNNTTTVERINERIMVPINALPQAQTEEEDLRERCRRLEEQLQSLFPSRTGQVPRDHDGRNNIGVLITERTTQRPSHINDAHKVSQRNKFKKKSSTRKNKKF